MLESPRKSTAYRPRNPRGPGPSSRLQLLVLLAVVSLALAGLDCTSPSEAKRETATAPTGGAEPSAESAPVELSRSQPLMGTTFRIEALADDSESGSRAIAAAFREVDRVEGLISSWDSSSQLSQVNRRAGEGPVEVGPELLELVETSLDISRRTRGAFDITFASCGSLWSFREPSIPSERAMRRCRQKIDYRRIELDPAAGTLFLPDEEIEIGVGGIGKGYGVDRAVATLEQHGIHSYIVDGGGDVRVRADGRRRPWRVGIAHPRRPDRLLGQLSVERGAVVSSGDYERYFERDGRRYHHILDPRTARPARKSVAVTVLADRAAEADALSTGLFVLGPKAGIALEIGRASCRERVYCEV